MEHGRHSSKNVRILNDSCNQPHLHHYRFKIWLWNSLKYVTYIVKLILHDTCLYIKSVTILFLFEHCIKHAYFWLCQNIHMVSKKLKHFVTILRQNCITDKCDAEKTLRGVYDQNLVIDCELLAYALDNIIYNALHEK